MNNYDILTNAQNLIRDPKNWTQELYARDEDDHAVEPASKQAVCYCSLGAIMRVTGLDSDTTEHPTFDLLEVAMGSFVTEFNDDRTHAEVMAAFDKARELAAA